MGNEWKKIVITGVPGTGKSTVASEIGERLNREVLHINSEFIKEKDMLIGIDRKAGSVEVNMEKLKDYVMGFDGVLESHLLCEFNLPDSIVISLRCEPETLKKRLSSRGYSEKKIRDNLESEALGYCTQLSESNYESVYEVETGSRSIEDTVEKCLDVIKGDSEGDGPVDYLEDLPTSL